MENKEDNNTNNINLPPEGYKCPRCEVLLKQLEENETKQQECTTNLNELNIKYDDLTN